jgi:hypothetical protein
MTILYVGRELKFFSPLPTVPLTELSLVPVANLMTGG